MNLYFWSAIIISRSPYFSSSERMISSIRWASPSVSSMASIVGASSSMIFTADQRRASPFFRHFGSIMSSMRRIASITAGA